MRNSHFRYRSLTAALILGGGMSAATAQPVFSGPEIQRLAESLPHHMNISDLVSDERGARYQAMKSFVFDRQCASGSANPALVVLLSAKFDLPASVRQDGGMLISGSAEKINIPMRIMPLAELPNEYLKDIAVLLEAKNLPGELVVKLQSDLPKTYDRLSAAVQRLLNEFDPKNCPSTRKPREDRYVGTVILFVPPTF